MDFNKIKDKFRNLDFNTFLASAISTMGAISTEDIAQILYVLCAVAAQIFAMRLSARREQIVREKMKEEVELQKEQRLMAIEQRRSLTIQNDKQL